MSVLQIYWEPKRGWMCRSETAGALPVGCGSSVRPEDVVRIVRECNPGHLVEIDDRGWAESVRTR